MNWKKPMRWNIKIFEIFSTRFFLKRLSVHLKYFNLLGNGSIWRRNTTCLLDRWNVFFELQWFVEFLWLAMGKIIGKGKLIFSVLKQLKSFLVFILWLRKCPFHSTCHNHSNSITKLIQHNIYYPPCWKEEDIFLLPFSLFHLKGFSQLYHWPQCG